MFHVKHRSSDSEPPPLAPAAFQSLTGVSDACLARLTAHLDLLKRWQRRINLVGRGSLDDPWRRHVLDSAQLSPLLPGPRPVVVDLGSGAGFPGLVLAIMGADADRAPQVHLVESDTRKAVFLREAVRLTGAPATVHACRIENLDLAGSDVAVARACAPLDRLLEYAAGVLKPGGVGLFLKGRTWRQELTDSRKNWNMTVKQTSSTSHPSGVVLQIGGIARRHDR